MPRTPKEPRSTGDGVRAARGRPRLTADDVRDRIDAYCKRYGVAPNREGLPPFPGGQRETQKHREWMALYKAQRRLAARGPSSELLERLRELLVRQHGRCPICRKPVELADARLDDKAADPAAVLHPPCLELVELARGLGADALDRVRARLERQGPAKSATQ
jgi:hypothetical protein